MTGLADQIMLLNKRVTLAENDALRKEFETLPPDVMAMTKTEFELRLELAQLIESCKGTKDWLSKEFSRLRREHYGNLKDIEQILVGFN